MASYMNWYAIYTKPGMEDIVCARLRQHDIPIFSPKLKTNKYDGRKYREVTEPLFPCYLFGMFERDKHLWMINYTRGVKKVVGGESGPWPVAEEVIELIRCHEKDGFVTVRQDEIFAGDRVRIADGPFAGLSGIFEEPTKGSERVVLLLSEIEYQARVVVARAALIKA
jgi:transcriptional antiterminator RfaH